MEKDPFQINVVDKSSVVLDNASDANMLFDDAASTRTLSFTTIAGWRAEFVNDRAADWCSISIERGKGGKNAIEISVTENTDLEERSASFNIISGVAKQTVVVTQKPTDSILMSASKVELDAAGGTYTLTAKATQSCTASVPSAYSSWLSIVESKAVQTNITYSVAPNEGFDVREGKIEVKTDLSSEIVTIYQKGVEPVIVLSKTSYDLKDAAAEIQVDVTSNVNVTVNMPSVDWISEIKSKATSTNTYNFAVTENQTTETRIAEIVFSNAEMGVEQTLKVVQAGKKGSDSIRILAIGNSFSDDSMWYLYDLLKQAGYKSIKLGNLYIGGCTLQTHADNITTGAGAYTYRINNDGKWVDNNSHSSIDAIKSDDWDIITLQQASGSSGMPETYQPYITTITQKVKELCPGAKLVWNMTWAYQGNSNHSEFPKYDKNQMTMYNAIVSAVSDKVLTNSDFVKVIPAGTAIQNLRTSLYGDTVTRDGYHLSYDSGRLTAAMMWLKSLTGCDLEKITWTPSGYIFTSARVAAIKEAVENAYANPYQVTPSTVTEDKEDPNASLPSLIRAAGYDPDMYDELELKITKVAYYNSANGNANMGTNMKNYAATQIFEKAQIPNGSLIVVKEGFQYRPEGWTALDVKTNPRPDNVTSPVIVVDDAWWREFNFRAFNLAKKGNPVLTDQEQDELLTVFGIFVPKAGTDEVFRAAGYKVEDYVKLSLDIVPYAHYNSQGSSDYSALIFTMTNFCATRIYAKNEIPNGSVIVQKEGYQYRPDGWTALDQRTQTRPGNVTDQIVVVNDAWWGDFNFRGFNLALKGSPKLTDEQCVELKSAFSIYVPKQ